MGLRDTAGLPFLRPLTKDEKDWIEALKGLGYRDEYDSSVMEHTLLLLIKLTWSLRGGINGCEFVRFSDRGVFDASDAKGECLGVGKDAIAMILSGAAVKGVLNMFR